MTHAIRFGDPKLLFSVLFPESDTVQIGLATLIARTGRFSACEKAITPTRFEKVFRGVSAGFYHSARMALIPGKSFAQKQGIVACRNVIAHHFIARQATQVGLILRDAIALVQAFDPVRKQSTGDQPMAGREYSPIVASLRQTTGQPKYFRHQANRDAGRQ